MESKRGGAFLPFMVTAAIGLAATMGLPGSASSSGKGEGEAKVVELKPLPKGISTWVYRYSDGVARQVKRFNAGARPDLRFRYFFPYAGSPDFNAEERRITMHYRPDASRAYAKTLPRHILLFPNVDGRNDHGEFDGWTDEQYREAARQVAQCILDDPNAAGVQIDIEPFKPDHLPFYRHLRTMLNAKGKYCTMFVGPWGGEVLRGIFQSCDIVVMSGYDLGRENMGVQVYREALQRGIARFQQTAEETEGHYMVGIPAAASWGEYEYIAGGPEGRQETGTKQEEYVRAALEELKPYQKRARFLGIALWHMSDPETEFEQPEKATEPTKFPNVIRPSVWKMLERY